MIVDMALQFSIEAFVETYLSKYELLDVLIHNAAAFDVTKKQAIYMEERVENIGQQIHSDNQLH
jgi:hypothetical protein